MMLGEHDKVDKRWVFEESQRMPLLMQYPRRIEPGSVSPALIDNTDFAPTLLSLAEVEVPSDMQGSSFEEALGAVSWEGKEAVYYRYWMHMAHHYVPAHYGIRTRQHKLIFFYGRCLDASGCFPDGPWIEPTEPGFELYDLYKDPLETHNVIDAPEYASIASKLKKQLQELKQRLGDDDSQYPELLELQTRYSSERQTKTLV
jgi:N-acetylglucosamine-6-sulfatase